jgi:hypothetical protein
MFAVSEDRTRKVHRFRKKLPGSGGEVRKVAGIAAVAVWLVLLTNCPVVAEAASTEEERSEAFAWFSDLGYPDVKNAPFVRVTTGQWSQAVDGPPQFAYRYGFLLGSEGDQFTVLFSDLTTSKLTKSPPAKEEYQQVGFKELDLPEYATGRLKSLREIDPTRPDHFRRFGERLAERAEIFVLAWGASRQGHDVKATELFNQALVMPSRRSGDEALTFRQELAAEIAHAEMWRAVLQFGDTTIPRDQLVEPFERIVKHFPESEHVEWAKETAVMLEQMIRDDREHAAKRRTGKPFAELTEEEKIAELIFQLRDQNGHQWSQPGSCDVFATFDGKEVSPAHQLVKFGYAAAPQLIEALDDPCFSRSVGYHRDFYFSHSALRVGDCAEQVLVRIAGRRFYRATHTAGQMQKDGQASAIKTEAKAWYAELQKKGEQKLLADEVEKGSDASPTFASRLVEKYPDAALPALSAGARRSESSWVRTQLIGQAGQIKGDAPIPFLLEELKTGPARATRLAAAAALHERGRAEAVAAMIVELDRPGIDPDDDEFGDNRAEVAPFLAGTGKIVAIEALMRNFAERSVDMRFSIVAAFGKSGPCGISGAAGAAFNPGRAPQAAERNEFGDAVRRLLSIALDDTEERVGVSGHWGEIGFTNPRICDMAGHVLHDMDPARYAFDLGASPAERERARLKLRNLLRKEQGLPEIPLPQPRIARPPGDEILRPLIDRYETAAGAAAAAAEQAVLELGVDALPAMVKRRDAAPESDPRRTKLDHLARRLSLLVTDIEIPDKSLPLERAIAGRTAELRNKPFEPAVYLELLDLLVAQTTREQPGFRLAAIRNEGVAGVTLRIELLSKKRVDALPKSSFSTPGPDAPKDRPHSWNYDTLIRVGRTNLYNVSGGGTLPGGKDDDEFFDTLRKAVDAPWEQGLDIRLSVISEWTREEK